MSVAIQLAVKLDSEFQGNLRPRTLRFDAHGRLSTIAIVPAVSSSTALSINISARDKFSNES
jgi:hypothetical protein